MQLEIPRGIRERLSLAVVDAGDLEIGGILMAEQLAPGIFRLVDFTIDDQKGSNAHFVRSVSSHQTALSEFFAQTGSDFERFNYLGEWHSHPNHPPIPSFEDIRSMQGLVSGEREIHFALLLVVRARADELLCSASLFQRNHPPSAVHLNKK